MDIRKILQGKSVMALAGTLSVAFFGLVSLMILLRIIPKEDFGNWVLYTTMVSFFDMIRFGLTKSAVVLFTAGDTENQSESKAYFGSSYRIGLQVVLVVVLVCWLTIFFVNYFDISMNQGYRLFFTWYPLLAIINLNWNNALTYYHSRQDFTSIFYLGTFNTGVFVLFLIVNAIFFNVGLYHIILAHIFINLIPSIYTFIKKTDGIAFLSYSTKETRKKILKFGYYSIGNFLGSSLLRSSDVFIISMSAVLGPVAVAIYAIPVKIADLMSIPLISFNMTAFPKMAAQWKHGNLAEVKRLFYSYAGATTIGFSLLTIISFLLIKPIVFVLAGDQYMDALPLITAIFAMFAISNFLLPIDRFTGLTLESLNKPHINFKKVIVMVIANIIGDLIAVFMFQSLVGVALATVVFTLLGIIIGYYYLDRELDLKFSLIFKEGWQTITSIKKVL